VELQIPPEGHFDYWFESIVSTANLIASQYALTQAWVHGDKSITSAYDFDEMSEQLLGDPPLPEIIPLFGNQLRRINALEPIDAFAQQLLDLREIVGSDPHLQDPQSLLTSPAWGHLTNTRAMHSPITSSEYLPQRANLKALPNSQPPTHNCFTNTTTPFAGITTLALAASPCIPGPSAVAPPALPATRGFIQLSYTSLLNTSTHRPALGKPSR
jgi:hypothetical protein